MGVVDLHHLAVWQAKERILNSLKILEKREDLQGLFLIHGFHGGTRIRDYIRNGPLKSSIKDRGINFGIDKFGESAPYKEVYDHFNITEESITNFIQKKLRE